MQFQRVIQTISLLIFLGLLMMAAYPYHEELAADIFLRLDPLIAVGTIVSTKEFIFGLVPGLIVILSTLLVGRAFCGHICPMGTTIDLGQAVLLERKKRRSTIASNDASSGFRYWKYLVLALIIGSALLSISLVHLASPLSMVTRLFGLSFYAIVCLAADTLLRLTSTYLSKLGLHSWAYMHAPEKIHAANAYVVVFFVGIVILSLIQPRFWCRNLCPAGALLGLFSRRPLIRRRVDDSCSMCRRCIRECPTGAVCDDPTCTVHSECIVCLHCEAICPEKAISFGPTSIGETAFGFGGVTRRNVLTSLGAGLMTAALVRTGFGQTRLTSMEKAPVHPRLIRPPGTLPEPEFLARCVRCGECMKACPTNTLQPILLEAGLEGLFSPALRPRLAACAVKCNVCGQVCPTGAIRDISLSEKNHAKIGTAWIVRQNCLVWEQDKKCLVCDEVCPYNAVAFRPVPNLRNAAPFILENRCLGCGWCENKCPVEGAAAIRINIIGEIRLASGSYKEKAKEYRYIFQAKGHGFDRLAPGTFNSGEGVTSPVMKELPQGNSTQDMLLPGFSDK